jgi:SpoVK/Ycf46/Vps4 family AAA+-type ATPase
MARMMHDERLRPVVDRLLATRRAMVEQTQNGTRRGLRVLFTGHSGKNKLLAAQLFAHELAVDLFEVDLSRIVSKYIGDTEKNLDALFKAAEASDAVLLFDDTSHLFGVTEPAPEDSGRFPNLNVAQFRQRIEAYDGVVMLGADDSTHIDPKLARQCDEVVDLD